MAETSDIEPVHVCVCVGARPKKGAEEAAQPKQDPLGAFSLIFYARSGTMMLEWHRNDTSCVPLCFAGGKGTVGC